MWDFTYIWYSTIISIGRRYLSLFYSVAGFKMTEKPLISFSFCGWYSRWQKPLLSFLLYAGLYARCRQALISFSLRNLLSLSHCSTFVAGVYTMQISFLIFLTFISFWPYKTSISTRPVFPTSLKASIAAAEPAAVALVNAGREGGRQDLIGGREGRLRPGPHHCGRQGHRQQAGRPPQAPH